jgi:hypothetical protein
MGVIVKLRCGKSEARMAEMGQERRCMQLATAGQLPLCPVSDRGRVAAQLVATGQKSAAADA